MPQGPLNSQTSNLSPQTCRANSATNSRYVRSFVKRQRHKFTKYSNVALRNKEHSRKAMGEQIIRHWPFCYSRIGYLQANGSPNVLESNYVDHLKISANREFSQITKPFVSSHSLSAMFFVPVGGIHLFFRFAEPRDPVAFHCISLSRLRSRLP